MRNLIQERIGEKNVSTAGQEMEIIGGRNSCDLTIRFEDGYIAEHKAYKCFRSGEVCNPNVKKIFPNRDRRSRAGLDIERARSKYLGESFKQKNGHIFTVIEYINNKDVIGEFEDGVRVRSSTALFAYGNQAHPDEKRVFKEENLQRHIGEIIRNDKCPEGVEILGGSSVKDVTVKFITTGVILEHQNYFHIKDRGICHPGHRQVNRIKDSAERRIGEEGYASNGVPFVIEGYHVDYKDNPKIMYHLKFADGSIMESYDGGAFKKGEVKHPRLNGAKSKGVNDTFRDFFVYERVYKIEKDLYYSCKCSKCNKEYIFTFKEMTEHECTGDISRAETN